MASAKGHTDLLRQFGLHRNPFTDRTAEKTGLDELSLYIRSDLQGFEPSGAQDEEQVFKKFFLLRKTCFSRAVSVHF